MPSHTRDYHNERLTYDSQTLPASRSFVRAPFAECVRHDSCPIRPSEYSRCYERVSSC